jgi:hypothetical protein
VRRASEQSLAPDDFDLDNLATRSGDENHARLCAAAGSTSPVGGE